MPPQTFVSKTLQTYKETGIIETIMNVEDRQLVFHFQNSASGHCLDSTGSGLPISDIREPVTIYMAIEDLRLKHILDQSGFDSAQPASVES